MDYLLQEETFATSEMLLYGDGGPNIIFSKTNQGGTLYTFKRNTDPPNTNTCHFTSRILQLHPEFILCMSEPSRWVAFTKPNARVQAWWFKTSKRASFLLLMRRASLFTIS